MRNPPKVFFKPYAKKSACTYYRSEVPARIIREQRLAYVTDEESEALTVNDIAQSVVEMMNHDVLHYYALAGPVVKKLQDIFKKTPCEQVGDELVTPPSFFEDLDDNIDYTSPLNFRFVELGTRAAEDQPLLKPGESVNIVLQDGSVVPLWQDEVTKWDKTVFSVSRNLQANKCFHDVLKKSQGVSFSTARLRDHYASVDKLKNTHVFPNSMIPEDYPDIRLRKEKGKIRVLWQGGASHYPDWFSIKSGFVEIAKRFPEMKWVIWGTKYDWIHGKIPADQLEYHEWVPYEAYKIKLAAMDFDIAIAPVVDNIFNRGKSCIKWYEAAIMPDPRPVVAANVPPYSDEMQDGVTGLLYNSEAEFVEKLGSLISNRKMRTTLAANSKDWVMENRDARKTVKPYFDWLIETHAGFQARKRSQHLRKAVHKAVQGA